MLLLILFIILYLLGAVITKQFATLMEADEEEVLLHSVIWPYVAIQILIHSIFTNNE